MAPVARHDEPAWLDVTGRWTRDEPRRHGNAFNLAIQLPPHPARPSRVGRVAWREMTRRTRCRRSRPDLGVTVTHLSMFLLGAVVALTLAGSLGVFF